MFEAINPLNFIFSGLVLWVIYITVEALRKMNVLDGEFARKAIHIGIGVLLATLPAYMTRSEIALFNGLFFLGLIGLVIAARLYFKFEKLQDVPGLGPLYYFGGSFFRSFRAYDDVGRWTIGQFLYPLSLMLVTFMFEQPIIYSFAVLELAMADGFAALVGKSFGNHPYSIPGGYKTLEGSTAFFIITVTLLSVFVIITGDLNYYTFSLVIAGSFFLTGVEGLIAAGFDNLAVPIFMGLLLQALA